MAAVIRGPRVGTYDVGHSNTVLEVADAVAQGRWTVLPDARRLDMAELVVIATLDAKPGREADLERALEALVAPTHAEAGCRAYVLHRDDAVPGRFVFYERWDGEADLAAHFETPHLKAFLGMADDLLAKPLDVVKCTEIAGGA